MPHRVSSRARNLQISKPKASQGGLFDHDSPKPKILNPKLWVLPPPPPLSNSWRKIVVWLYIALNRTPVTGAGQYPTYTHTLKTKLGSPARASTTLPLFW